MLQHFSNKVLQAKVTEDSETLPYLLRNTRSSLLARMPLILCLLLFLTCCFSVSADEENQNIPCVSQIAALADPAKLITLKAGNRAANQRFRKLMAYIHLTEKAGQTPKVF